MKSLFCIISLTFFISFSGYSQTCITGRVIDARTNQPLSGVTIKIAEKALGAVTDSNGNFSLCDIKQAFSNIVISHIGYKSELKSRVRLNEIIEVNLMESPIELNPIVVTATLTPQSTWEVPAMVSVIDSINLRSQSALNTDNYLRTIPGLYIDRSNGVFSKNAAVTMRGLDGSNRVLILYDGEPLNKTS